MISLLSPGLLQREYFRLPFDFVDVQSSYTLPVSDDSYARGFVYVPVFLYAYNGCDTVVASLRFADVSSGVDLSNPVDLNTGENVVQYTVDRPPVNYPISTSGIQIMWNSGGGMTSGNLSGFMYYSLVPLRLIL